MEACEYELVFFMLDLNQWKNEVDQISQYIVQLDGRLLQINLSLSHQCLIVLHICIALFYISLLWNDCYSCDCIYCVEFEHLSKQHVPLYIIIMSLYNMIIIYNIIGVCIFLISLSLHTHKKRIVAFIIYYLIDSFYDNQAHPILFHPLIGPHEHFLHFIYQNKGYRLTIFGYMVLPPEGLFLPTIYCMVVAWIN